MRLSLSKDIMRYPSLGRKFSPDSNESGFTLVEILVVILIVGILAAIAIPVFLNQRQKANDASVQSDIRNAVMVTKTYITNNPDITTADWSVPKSMMAKNSQVRLTWTGTPQDFCIEGQHTNGKAYISNWTYSSITGDTKPGSQNGQSCSGYGTTTFNNHYVWNAG